MEVLKLLHIAALKELDDQNQLNHVERVAGTSAGAVVAALVAVGYTVPELMNLTPGMDIGKFSIGCNPLRIFTKYRIHRGD